MSRLAVLSNRVKMPDSGPMAGGLAVALQDVLVGSSVIWMGWNGKVVDNKADDTDNFCSYTDHEFDISEDIALGTTGTNGASTTVTYLTTTLTTKQYQHFYCGFANNVLWPLLHEQADLISQTPEDYAGYESVNRLFARQLKKVLHPEDVIWVHDYHFLSVAYYCRQLGMRNRIGFFLHIPFAPLIFWQQLNQSAELIEHLAHYDVLGMQTQQNKTNFLAVFRHYLKASLLSDLPINTSYMIQSLTKDTRSPSAQLMLNLPSYPTHCLTINAYPIGINAARIQQQTMDLSIQSIKPNPKRNRIKPAAQQIIAVDRIDYSKGLLERFSAYRHFLQHYPVYQNQLKLIQIACPSRLDLPTYQCLYNTVKQTVTDINQQFSPDVCQTTALPRSTFSTDSNASNFIENWQAITYSEQVLSHETLMRVFWHSDIGWVNSLKDGMNLVAKEYIAAQNPDDPGVLLLSRYAGAAEQMQAAIIIDPRQPKSIIQGLKKALEMPLMQRKERYQELLYGLQQDNLHAWQQDFLDDLYGNKEHQVASARLETRQMPERQE